ncbi:MAG TPA: hypothetical protein VMD58_05690 [Acidobacteriaceae bacterium]|nr:hypothetical protein [Acidobacteriaceae bacterium]
MGLFWTDGNGTFAICLNSKWQFRPHHETLEMSLTGYQFKKTARRRPRFPTTGSERLNAIPGVEASGWNGDDGGMGTA